ncbi:MAG: RusA family crossover junction endodeoxyribonuclease [Nanoarchaeota archaeon]|nr:RusA family crossover junction endodeoxyribonuclease [Nanoarchaeota archaeon]
MNTKKKEISSISVNETLVLKDDEGMFHDLIVIKSTKKKEINNTIKEHLNEWMDNPHFKDKSKKFDVAIVIYVDNFRMKKQDVDNISKVVLDALKKSKNPKEPHLFEDDSQVVRLLIYKLPSKRTRDYNTNSLVISFREHNPSKQMILVKKKVI